MTLMVGDDALSGTLFGLEMTVALSIVSRPSAVVESTKAGGASEWWACTFEGGRGRDDRCDAWLSRVA